MFNWEERSKVRDMGNGKVRTAGVAMGMQGSCISNVDVGSATLKLSEDGTYNLIIGAADMGTGCDTILAQMVAELMDCDVDDVAVFGAKSIGEIVINTPGPAIAHAIYRATGVWHRELPITPEKIAMSIEE